MGTFVLAYRGGITPESEEEQKQVMAAWQSWFGALGDSVVDMGSPFVASAAVGGGATFGLTGYSIVAAESLEAALSMAGSCPILESGGGVEVYETYEM